MVKQRKTRRTEQDVRSVYVQHAVNVRSVYVQHAVNVRSVYVQHAVNRKVIPRKQGWTKLYNDDNNSNNNNNNNNNKLRISVSVHHKSVIHNKPTRCNSGSIVFINNRRYDLHVSEALCVHHQEHYKV